MAVEGYGRVPLGQAGTGEAFMLGESQALKTYVDKEQAQIAAKQKADEEAMNRELPDYGWFYADTMNKDIEAYREQMFQTVQNGGDPTNLNLKKQYEDLKQKAILTKKYTTRLDELNKADSKQLWGENAKYFDKSLLIKGITGKLTDENGNPKDPLQVNSKDLEDIYDPNAFLTNVFVDDFVTNIKDQFVDANTGFVKEGYGTYIQNTEKGIRFVTTDAQGNVVPGVDNNVAQLALDNPIYSQVIGKKVDEDLSKIVDKLIAEGVDEKEAKELVAIKRKDFMMDYAKEDILAYQQLSSKADMKLGINNATSKAALDQGDAAKKNADTNAKKENRASRKQELELEANATTKASIIPTKIQSVNGTTANLGAFGSVGVPKDKIAKKDGENGVKEGEAIPRSFSLNSVYNISSGGLNTKGTSLRVQGKESQAGTFSPIEEDYGQKQYQPQSITKILVNKEGELVDITGIGSKTDAELAQVARENGLQLLEAAEMKDMATGDIILTPMEGNPERQNIYNYFNTDYERANKSLGEVEGVSRYEKLDAQGTKDRSQIKKKSSTASFNKSSSNLSTSTGGDFD